MATSTVTFIFFLLTVISSEKSLSLSLAQKMKEKTEPKFQKSVPNIICNNDSCNPKYGVCTDNSTCECLPGFVNLDRSSQYCNYRMKHQKTAFYLELMLPYGTSYYYLGKNGVGFIKNMLFITLVSLMLFAVKIHRYDKDFQGFYKAVYLFLAIIVTLTYFVWHIMDLGNLASSEYTDLRHMPLYAMNDNRLK